MNQIKDLLVFLGSKKTHGYGPRPIPDAIDQKVRELVTYLGDADPSTRNAIFSMMSEHHGLVLLAFAERMASLAVRTRNLQFIREGLEALAYGIRLVDDREVLMVLSLLYRSSIHLDLDAAGFFAGTIGLGGEMFDSFLLSFPRRNEEDRSIGAMGYIESRDQDGFRYRRTW
jgi:hypothetical protein